MWVDSKGDIHDCYGNVVGNTATHKINAYGKVRPKYSYEAVGSGNVIRDCYGNIKGTTATHYVNAYGRICERK